MLRKLFVLTRLTSLLSIPEYSSAKAQNQGGSFYIGQEGHSLWQIASGFGVAIENLIKENSLSDAGRISVGSKLFIPGLNGYDGEVTATSVVFCGTVGTELYASAAGRVTSTGSPTIRGNDAVVDHGWGYIQPMAISWKS